MYEKEMKYHTSQLCFTLMWLFIISCIAFCTVFIPLYVCGRPVLKYLPYALSLFLPAVVTGCIGSILKISLYIKYHNKKAIPTAEEEITVQKLWNSLISGPNKGIEWGYLTLPERKAVKQFFIEYSKRSKEKK